MGVSSDKKFPGKMQHTFLFTPEREHIQTKVMCTIVQFGDTNELFLNWSY